MQYILSEEEYTALQQKQEMFDQEDIHKLQVFCTRVADEMPIKFWDNEIATPWGCILSKEGHCGYCDECPAQEICPHDSKRWSQ